MKISKKPVIFAGLYAEPRRSVLPYQFFFYLDQLNAQLHPIFFATDRFFFFFGNIKHKTKALKIENVIYRKRS